MEGGTADGAAGDLTRIDLNMRAVGYGGVLCLSCNDDYERCDDDYGERRHGLA